MRTSQSIRTVRTALAVTIAVGLALAVFGLLVGMNIPGLIASVAGWTLVIAGIAWLIINWSQRSSAASRTQTWRPGDESTPHS